MFGARRLLAFGLFAAFATPSWFHDSAAAAEVAWRRDIKKAFAEAKAQNKPILVQVTASWCHYCHKMFDETYTDDRIIERVNGCFIPLMVDGDEHPDTVRWIGVNGYPTTAIVSPQRKVVNKISGYQVARSFAGWLDRACRTHRASKTPNQPSRAVAGQTNAFGGYCLVSMLDDHVLRPGSSKYLLERDGRSYRFASAAHRVRFLADPDRYFPAYGGRCVSCGAGATIGHPRWAAIYRERLFFFASKSTRQKFLDDPDSYLR